MEMWIGKVELNPENLNFVIVCEGKNKQNQKEVQMLYGIENKSMVFNYNYIPTLPQAVTLLQQAQQNTQNINSVKYVLLKQNMFMLNVANVKNLSYKKSIDKAFLTNKYDCNIAFKDGSSLPIKIYEKDMQKLKQVVAVKQDDLKL